jgi:hypothetical protein
MILQLMLCHVSRHNAKPVIGITALLPRSRVVQFSQKKIIGYELSVLF